MGKQSKNPARAGSGRRGHQSPRLKDPEVPKSVSTALVCAQSASLAAPGPRRGKISDAGQAAPDFRRSGTRYRRRQTEEVPGRAGGDLTTCKPCHKAAGSAFIQVTLNSEDSISLRYPYVLAKNAMAGGHIHGAPTMMQEMQKYMEDMTGGASDQDHHHEAGSDEYHDDDKHQG